MSLEIAALKEEHLEKAAKLFCTRFQALRREVPVLPVCYQEVGPILDLLRDLSGGAEGVTAIQDGSLVGFLIGLVIPDFMGKRSAYTPVWANAATPGQARRIYEDMYARISDRWVEDGCFTHVISLMAHERQVLEAWNWLGFGLVNVDCVRPVIPLEGGHFNVEVRQVRSQNASLLSELG